jgi:hypothetical protein
VQPPEYGVRRHIPPCAPQGWSGSTASQSSLEEPCRIPLTILYGQGIPGELRLDHAGAGTGAGLARRGAMATEGASQVMSAS